MQREVAAERVVRVANSVAPLRGIQAFLQCQVTVRTLVNPRIFPDSREFLKSALFGFGPELSEFGRDPQLFGLSMAFPALPDEPSAFTIKIESFRNDPRSLFIENRGAFGPQVVARGLDGLGENIRRTYEFVVERVIAFLEHFDERAEA